MQFFVTGTFFDHHDHLKAGKPQSAEYTFSSRSFSVKSASLAQINSDHSSFFKVKVVQSKDFKRYNFYFERKSCVLLVAACLGNSCWVFAEMYTMGNRGNLHLLVNQLVNNYISLMACGCQGGADWSLNIYDWGLCCNDSHSSMFDHLNRFASEF